MSTPDPASVHIERRISQYSPERPYWVVVDETGADYYGSHDLADAEHHAKVRRGVIKAMITRRRNKAAQ